MYLTVIVLYGLMFIFNPRPNYSPVSYTEDTVQKLLMYIAVVLYAGTSIGNWPIV